MRETVFWLLAVLVMASILVPRSMVARAHRYRVDDAAALLSLGLAEGLWAALLVWGYMAGGEPIWRSVLWGGGIFGSIFVFAATWLHPRRLRKQARQRRADSMRAKGYTFAESDVAPSMGYRDLFFGRDADGNSSMYVWHTSKRVPTHYDIQKVNGTDRFCRRYLGHMVDRGPLRRARRRIGEITQTRQVPLSDFVPADYLAQVASIAPEDWQRIIARITLARVGIALVPERACYGTRLPSLDDLWVFPPSRIDKGMSGVGLTTLIFEPRVLEMASLLCEQYSSKFSLVSLKRRSEDALQSGVPIVSPLSDPETVAAGMLEAMTPLPFLGLIVEGTAAGSISESGSIALLAKTENAVEAIVVGIFDGESFAVFPCEGRSLKTPCHIPRDELQQLQH